MHPSSSVHSLLHRQRDELQTLCDVSLDYCCSPRRRSEMQSLWDVNFDYDYLHSQLQVVQRLCDMCELRLLLRAQSAE